MIIILTIVYIAPFKIETISQRRFTSDQHILAQLREDNLQPVKLVSRVENKIFQIVCCTLTLAPLLTSLFLEGSMILCGSRDCRDYCDASQTS